MSNTSKINVWLLRFWLTFFAMSIILIFIVIALDVISKDWGPKVLLFLTYGWIFGMWSGNIADYWRDK